MNNIFITEKGEELDLNMISRIDLAEDPAKIWAVTVLTLFDEIVELHKRIDRLTSEY